MRVLVATSTLAWGVNLPARRVVILGVKRGISNDVHPVDIVQMSGRAGRAGLDEKGDAYVLLPELGFEQHKKFYSTVPPIMSGLGSDTVLVFHAIAEMDASGIRTPSQLVDWFDRSLAAHQAGPMTIAQADAVFDMLLGCHAIKPASNGIGYVPTALGRISSWLYFDPRNVWSWAKNLKRMSDNNLWSNDAVLATALGKVDEGTLDYVPRDVQLESMGFATMLVNTLDSEGHYQRLGKSGFRGFTESWAYYAALTGATVDNGCALYVRIARNDIERVAQAFKLIDSMWGHWGRGDELGALPLRVRYGVGQEMLPLVRLPAIGGVRAKKLWDAGFRDLRTVADPSKKRLLVATVGANVATKAASAAGRMLRSEAA